MARLPGRDDKVFLLATGCGCAIEPTRRRSRANIDGPTDGGGGGGSGAGGSGGSGGSAASLLKDKFLLGSKRLPDLRQLIR